MKNFTAPDGLFTLQVPVDWQYSNVAIDLEEKNPFCFQHYQDPKSSFQISCYPRPAEWKNQIQMQTSNTANLQFETERMDDEEFNMHLWFANVEDYYFIIKFIYDGHRENSKDITEELEKITVALSTLQLLTGDRRARAIELDVYEKFIASLAASFDLRDKALENLSLIELIIILANQIDAYLRMAIMLHHQLKEKTERIDVGLLRQEKKDRPVSEKEIYKIALETEVISESLYNSLFGLYSERNKVVHRYIISDFRTRELSRISYAYYEHCEEVRMCLKRYEDQQSEQKTGIYKSKMSKDLPNDLAVQVLFSQVNDKHLDQRLFHDIKPAKI